MELNNGSASVFASNAPQYLEYYVQRELYDSGWAIGVNELGHDIKALVDTSSDETPLARLQRICTAFDCEMSFSLDFQNLRIKRKLVNIFHRIGADKTDRIFYSGRDVTTMRTSVSTDNIITAIEDSNSGFDDLSTGDGRYFTRMGESIIYDRVANAQYGRGNTSEERFSGFITKSATSTASNPMDCYTELLKVLQSSNEPSFSAEVELVFQDGDFAVGDSLTFVDEDYNPALRLKARVASMELHPDDQTQNTITITNATQLASRISSDLLAKQQQVEDTAVYVLKLSTDNGSGFVDGIARTTTVTATLFRDGEDITSTLTPGDLIWYKVDKSGAHDAAWEAANADKLAVTVADTDVVESGQVRCAVMLIKKPLVQAIYFIDGLKAVARKALRLQTADTVTSVHISDTHYATDTIARDDLENYSRSAGHVKNVAELSQLIDLDYIVHNGDTHDGGTASKDIALSNFREIVSNLGLAKCPYFVSWGNHDNNCWGDTRTNSISKVIRNYKPATPGTKGLHGKGAQMLTNREMYEVATRPSTIFGIVTDPANSTGGYYYYDVPGKPMRVLVLNPQDIPDGLDTDGYIKYQGLNCAGYRQAQIAWLAQTLMDTPAGTTVAIYQHFGFGYRYSNTMAYVPYNYEMIDGIIDAFVSGGTYSGSYTANADFKASVDCDFGGAKGLLAFLAHGHFHNDKMVVGTDGIHSYSIGCSVSRPKKDQGDRPLGKLEEDLWDVVLVDTDKHHVDLLRFGAGTDQSFDY
nr:phage tail spike protein [Lacticaseibacillus parakribbianus]